MQTIQLPKRVRKGTVTYSAKLVKDTRAALDVLKPGEATAYDAETWYDTEGKARGKARVMAHAIAELTGGPVPRTHVVPDETGEKWTPAVSPRRES